MLIPLFPALPFLDIILGFIPILLGIIGVYILLHALKKEDSVTFVSSAGTRLSAGSLSTKFLAAVREQCYNTRKVKE
jgi:hypothetical protein